MSLTCTIAGNSVDIQQNAISRPDRIDERTALTITIIDLAGTALYQKGQPIVVTDSILGTVFQGYVNQPQATLLYPNPGKLWTLNCISKGDYLAGKRTSNKTYANQYAGTIAVDQVQRNGAAEGLSAKAALRWDELQTDWQSGTLTNTVATTNASDGNPGDGDLELSLAGTPISIVESGSTFSTGTLAGVQVTNGKLAQIPFNAIKVDATQNLNNGGNTYSYTKIWSGSYTIPAAPNSGYFIYDMYVLKSSPEIKIAIDFVCSDGTTWRDNATEYDAQSMPPHPKTDLTGLADGQWYSNRRFGVQTFQGKTVSYVSIGVEGDKPGEYIAYFKNIYFANASSTPVQYIYNNAASITPQQLQVYGYSSTIVNAVPCYDAFDTRTISYSIDAAKIAASTYISWQSTQKAPAGTTSGTASAQNPQSYVETKYSLDGGNSYILCQNNAKLPDFPTGLPVAGSSIQFLQFLVSGTPEDSPTLNRFAFQLTPAYNGTTASVINSVDTAAAWATGTFSNTTNNSGPTLSLSGAIRNWDNADSSNQPLYGSSNPAIFTSDKTLALGTDSGTDARCRMDFAGQYQNFTMEVDVQVTTNTLAQGFVYRTTNWGNANDSYGYTVTLSTTQLLLGHGTNSTGAGGFTAIASVTLSLATNNWHRLKVVVNGTSHQVYLDDILMINQTDSTYNFTGYVGLRTYNNSGSHQTGYFDNFGVAPVLSGTWISPAISLNALGTYASSDLYYADVSTDHSNCTIKAEYTINGGTSWVTIFNGVTAAPYSFSGALPGLTVGQSLVGISLQLRFTLTTTTVTAQPQINAVVLKVLGSFSATGTRVSPALSLAGVGRAGSTLVNWNANLPSGTSLAVATSIDGGVTYQSVASAGAAISGITVQPTPVEDLFTSNTSANYTTSSFGSGTGTQTFDTTNSRIIWSGANNAVMLYNSLSVADCVVTADFDQADNAGLACRATGSSTMYALYLYDSSATTFGLSNTWFLYKIVSGAFTQLATGNAGTGFTLARGTYHRFTLSCIGSTISASMDGVTLASVTDSGITAAGKAGLIGGALSRVYSLRLQGQGQNVTALSLLTKVTLTSTNPLNTPQLLDMQSFVSSPDIGPGILVPSVAYQRTFLSDNWADLNTKSNYWTYIRDDGSLVLQARTATPTPFVLSSLNSQVIAGQTINDVLVNGAELDNSADSYRNRQIMTGAIATATFPEIKVGDGTTTSWTLNNPVAAPPTVFQLNGQTVTFGVQGVDSGKQYYYQIGSATINQDSSQSVLQGTDALEITYLGSFSQDVVLDNTSMAGTITQSMMAAIDGSSGIVEAVQDVSQTPTTVAAATTAGNQLLQRYGNIGRTFKFKTLRSGLLPGMQLALFVPEFNLANVQMLVTEVDVSIVSAPSVSGGLLYTWQVTAMEGPNLGSWVKLFTNAFNK